MKHKLDLFLSVLSFIIGLSTFIIMIYSVMIKDYSLLFNENTTLEDGKIIIGFIFLILFISFCFTASIILFYQAKNK